MSAFSVFDPDENESKLRIAFYPVFTYLNYNCELSVLVLFPSGRIVCNWTNYDLDGIRKLVQTGNLRPSVREGERVFVTDVTSFDVANVFPTVKERDFLNELEDIIRELNGIPTTSDVCRNAYKEYLQNPIELNRLRLKDAYERVPSHTRYALLGFDEKDIPIRKAISRDEA